MAAAAERLKPEVRRLVSFLETLRRAGYRIGMQQYFDAHAVAEQWAQYCADTGEDLNSPRLAYWLAPIVCTDGEEQKEFYRHFEQLIGRPIARAIPDTDPLLEFNSGVAASGSGTDLITELQQTSWRKGIVLFLAALSLAGIAYLALRPTPPSPNDLTTENLTPATTITATESEPGSVVVGPAGSGSTNGSAGNSAADAVIVQLAGRVIDDNGDPVAGASIVASSFIGSLQSEPETQLFSIYPYAEFHPTENAIIVDEGYSLGIYSLNPDIDNSTLNLDLLRNFDFSQLKSISRDGQLVMAEFENSAGIWELSSGQFILELRHSDSVEALAFSPDSNRAVVGTADGEAVIWNITDGTRMLTLQHSDPVKLVAYNPDGNSVVTVTGANVVSLWNANTGVRLTEYNYNPAVNFVKFSESGERLLIGYDDAAIVWETESAQPLSVITSVDPVRVGAISPNGKYVLLGSDAGIVTIFEAAAGNSHFISSLRVDEALIRAIEFDNAGDRLIVTSTGSPAPAAAGNLSLWNFNSLLMPRAHDGPVRTLSVIPDESELFSAAEDRVVQWNLDSGELLTENPSPAGVSTPMFSTAAPITIITTSYFGIVGAKSSTGDLLLWTNADDETEELQLSGANLTALAYADEIELNVTAYDDGATSIWDGEDNATAPQITLQDDFPINSVAIRPDGSQVATGTQGGAAKIWDVQSGVILHTLQHARNISLVEFSPDGQLLLTAVEDGSVSLWDPESGARLVTLAHTSEVGAADFMLSADNLLLLTGTSDGTVTLWDATNGAQVFRTQFESPVHSLALLSNNDFLAGFEDGTVRLNRIATSGAAGRFSLTLQDPLATSFLYAYHPLHGSTNMVFLSSGINTYDVDVVLSRDAPIALRLLFEYQGWIMQFLIALLLVSFAFWWYWCNKRRDIVANRRSSESKQQETKIALAEAEHTLYTGEGYLRARTAALRRSRGGRGELEVNSTIEETARKLGWFSPRYRVRSEQPEYLVLIDRQSFNDQQARLNDEFIDRLQHDGVHIHRYYYNGDPRICKSASRYGRALTLKELAARYHQHRLLIFSDGRGLLNPLNGNMAGWAEALNSWHARALMTPAAMNSWSAYEQTLLNSGLRVVPASPVGLQIFLESIASVSRTAINEGDQRPLPSIISTRYMRWLDRVEPDENELFDLIRDVKWYLGEDGFRWLAALAVYPELNWQMTLHLGLGLQDASGKSIVTEELLLSMTRLPWLRRGYMPDWLRVALVKEISKDDQELVREILFDQTLDQINLGDKAFHLHVARDSQDHKKPLLRTVLRHFFNSEPQESALRDYVFIEFLMGKQASKLQTSVPPAWKSFVYHQGSRALGLRTLPVALAIITVSLLLSQSGAVIDTLYAQSERGENSISLVPDVDFRPTSFDAPETEFETAALELMPVQTIDRYFQITSDSLEFLRQRISGLAGFEASVLQDEAFQAELRSELRFVENIPYPNRRLLRIAVLYALDGYRQTSTAPGDKLTNLEFETLVATVMQSVLVFDSDGPVGSAGPVDDLLLANSGGDISWQFLGCGCEIDGSNVIYGFYPAWAMPVPGLRPQYIDLRFYDRLAYFGMTMNASGSINADEYWREGGVFNEFIQNAHTRNTLIDLAIYLPDWNLLTGATTRIASSNIVDKLSIPLVFDPLERFASNYLIPIFPTYSETIGKNTMGDGVTLYFDNLQDPTTGDVRDLEPLITFVLDLSRALESAFPEDVPPINLMLDFDSTLSEEVLTQLRPLIMGTQSNLNAYVARVLVFLEQDSWGSSQTLVEAVRTVFRNDDSASILRKFNPVLIPAMDGPGEFNSLTRDLTDMRWTFGNAGGAAIWPIPLEDSDISRLIVEAFVSAMVEDADSFWRDLVREQRTIYFEVRLITIFTLTLLYVLSIFSLIYSRFRMLSRFHLLIARVVSSLSFVSFMYIAVFIDPYINAWRIVFFILGAVAVTFYVPWTREQYARRSSWHQEAMLREERAWLWRHLRAWGNNFRNRARKSRKSAANVG